MAIYTSCKKMELVEIAEDLHTRGYHAKRAAALAATTTPIFTHSHTIKDRDITLTARLYRESPKHTRIYLVLSYLDYNGSLQGDAGELDYFLMNDASLGWSQDGRDLLNSCASFVNAHTDVNAV